MTAISSFAEACLRAYESGLEGISVHGEVTSRTLCWKLNYLAMRHWTYHPLSTLQEFAEAELTTRVGGIHEAGLFVEALCDLEKADYRATMHRRKQIMKAFYPNNYPARGNMPVSRIWHELDEWFRHATPGCVNPRGMTDLI